MNGNNLTGLGYKTMGFQNTKVNIELEL